MFGEGTQLKILPALVIHRIAIWYMFAIRLKEVIF